MTTSQVDVIALDTPLPRAHTASVYLCGPTPLDPGIPSWRPAAVECLRQVWNSAGRLSVYVPEATPGRDYPGYADQVRWEEWAIASADVILFHVPRRLPETPCLVTNVKWGRFADSGRAVVSLPPDAERNEYLAYFADAYDVPQAATLDHAALLAAEMIGTGSERLGVEQNIPLLIWRSPQFQRWYRTLSLAGTRLRTAHVLWSHTLQHGPDVPAVHWTIELTVENGAKQFLDGWTDKFDSNAHTMAEPTFSVNSPCQ